MTSLVTEISLILGLALLELTKTKIGKAPAHFATDWLPACIKSSKSLAKIQITSCTFTLQAKETMITTIRWNASIVRSGIVRYILRSIDCSGTKLHTILQNYT